MKPSFLYLLFFALLAACTGAPPAPLAPAPAAATCTGNRMESSANATARSGCSHVFGDLYIENSAHTDLSILSNVRSVSGTLFIGANPRLNSLKGLEQLNSVGQVVLLNNPELRDLSALSGLSEARAITIIGNPRLIGLSGPAALRHLDGLVIADNDGLISVGGFAGLFTAGDVVIAGNRALIRMPGLADLTFAEHLYLENNPRLAPTPKLFRSLTTVQDGLLVGQCPGVRPNDIIQHGNEVPVATLDKLTTSNW